MPWRRWTRSRDNSQIGGCANHHFFQLLHVPADIPTMIGEVQNRIGDHLAGAMIGDVAATVRGMEFNVHLRKQVTARKQMLLLAVPSQGDYVGVLAQQQHIGNGSGFSRRYDPALQITALAVGYQPQIHNPANLAVCVQYFPPPVQSARN